MPMDEVHLEEWCKRQTYIALGFALAAAQCYIAAVRHYFHISGIEREQIFNISL